MILTLIAYLAVVLAIPLGYAAYRARRIAMIERMGRQLYSETRGYINGRPYRLANDGTPIYGYQPRDNPLLNRAPNPDLDIIYSKSGKPPQSITSDVIAGAPIGRYIPDTDTWELAPYVKQEFEDRVGDMLQVEML